MQLTPRGSVCSIAFGEGITDAEPGAVHRLQVVGWAVQASCPNVGCAEA